MKKKIYSLIMGICLFFAGVFTFSGCSLVSKDNSSANAEIVMKIGDRNISKNDLINAFYTYYQNNSSYFAYYDEATIESSFYTWFTVKTMVEELSFKELYDVEKNPNGKIYYTNEDATEVWKNVEDYFYSQVSAYEKALYSAEGVKEDDYPTWLHDHDHDEDEESAKFEFYSSPKKEIKFRDRKSDVTKKLSDQEVYDRVEDLKTRLFKYVESEDEEGNETLANITDDGMKNRNQAYANYIQALVSNAKANGVSTKIDDVLKAEVLRIYKAYYDSQIGVIFQNYYIQDQLLNYQGLGDAYTLSDRAVVAKFLDKYYTERQVNRLQDGYVETMESKDGASLVLYHYQGRDYYFSVQHILVKFTDYIMEQVEGLEGYGVTNAGQAIYEKYIADRENLATVTDGGSGLKRTNKAILTEVSKTAQKDTLVSVGEYYYYDEAKKEVYDEDNGIYYGYVKLTTSEFNETTKEYEVKTSKTYKTSDAEPKEITWESDEAKLMATVEDVLKAFEINYTIWKEKVSELWTPAPKSVDEVISADDKYEELRYVLEVAHNMKLYGATDAEVYNKISSLLFVELEWLYSGDSLGNEISNKIGYIVSSQDDNNMNWVVDFAVGAREMLAEMFEDGQNDEYEALTNDQKAIYTKAVLTDYGYHIMKIENVYNKANSSIIDLSKINKEYSLEHNSEYVQEVTKLLKKTYVCNGSNETLYDHFYDELYSTLVGTGESAGTYFLSLEYEWLAKYYEDSKIETIKKVDYHELLDSIS